MTRLQTATIVLAAGATAVFAWWVRRPTAFEPLVYGGSPATQAATGYTGSGSCRKCHESFYQKWATSRHGLAMQPFTAGFAGRELSPQTEDVAIGKERFRIDIAAARMIEKSPAGEKSYTVEHVLGGKNVYYFLTPLERGRLQVLPVAYDARKKEWFDTAGSMVRHVLDRNDAPLEWTHRALTFNTSCYGCHVSQLSTNYDLAKDTYHTAWAEPGINCETCHGPGGEHVRVYEAAASGGPKPASLHLVSTKPFDAEQTNAMCAPCHAKMLPVTPAYKPGEHYYDHYDLVTLEDPDCYPDGTAMGETYTYVQWRISPCLASGKFDCMHCHTSSGRNKHAGKDADNACLPCHENHVRNPVAHSHHPVDKPGGRCVDCHMAETMFARMMRHDHTMLAPSPQMTIKLGVPNACNICHKDKDAAWSQEWVSKWYPRDYQAPLVRRAELIAAARKRDWSRLGDMLAYLTDPKRNEIFATSFVRLLESCDSPDKWPAIRASLSDPSPLVRSAAAVALGYHADVQSRDMVLAATTDGVRLVRVRAAAVTAGRLREPLQVPVRRGLQAALAEYVDSLRSRPDDSASHYNMGNLHMDLDEPDKAVGAFETAVKLAPETVPALVNASIAHARLGRVDKAEAVLREALRIEPNSSAAHFNLGLLMAEQGRKVEAEAALRAAIKADPNAAEAMGNLGVLVAEDNLDEAIVLCRRAAELRPGEPKHAYTCAFFVYRKGDRDAAAQVLRELIRRHPAYADAYALLGTICAEQGRQDEARELEARLRALQPQ